MRCGGPVGWLIAAGLATSQVGLVAGAVLVPVTVTGPESAMAAMSGVSGRALPVEVAADSGLRYVALGDSVPYGHGLANPGRTNQSGLPPDQGPSPLAWPSWVDARLPGLAPLSLRPTGCGLVGPKHHYYDQLAVSGAPVQDNKWTGSDADCPRLPLTPSHKAVVPNEIGAANLKADPPALVTIQAGADDIDFAACLKALITLQSGACVTHDKSGYHLTAKTASELASVTDGLKKAISGVQAAAPFARILLVDYYQIVPAASAPVQGSSFVCRILRHGNAAYRKYLRAAADYVQARLNDAIDAAAKAQYNVSVIDIGEAFANHEMCTSHSWVFDGLWRAAHPTEHGQGVIGQAVVAFCRNPANYCLDRSVNGWTAAKEPPPADPGQFWSIPQRIACPHVGRCTVVGEFSDPSGNRQGLLISGSGKSWTETKAPVPSGAASNPYVVLYSITCVSATVCAAVGLYVDSSGNEQGLIVTGAGRTWTATEAPIPAGAGANPQAWLASVACASVVSCTAVGSYTDSSGSQQGLIVTGSGSSWMASRAPVPAGAASNPSVALASVACPSAACTAVGGYTDASAIQHGLILTGSGSSWTATRAPVPKLYSGRDAGLAAVACPSVTSCTAVGSYTGAYGAQALAVTGAGSSWTAHDPGPCPNGCSHDNKVRLISVACASATSCVAVGGYNNGSALGLNVGLIVSRSGAVWHWTSAPTPPRSYQSLGFQSVTCPAAGSCVAVGAFLDASYSGHGLILTGSGTSWRVTKAPLPLGTPDLGGFGLTSVSCASAAACTAVGYYYDASTHHQPGVLITGPA